MGGRRLNHEGAFRAALAKDYNLMAEAYCDGDCPLREVTIHVKDHDKQLLRLLKSHGLTCPLCGHELKLHWVRTGREDQRHRDEDSRCSVNAQMYRRDTDGFSIPCSVLCDDRLPPTPDGWFSTRG